MKMYDIEDNIMKCWSVVDDLKILGHNEIASLYNKKFELLFAAYESVLDHRIQDRKSQMELNEYPPQSVNYEDPF